ncbi:MAG: hypothetical protein IPM54_10180 [Polyangiaceae bacterium]|nr:hypothetical protein [Polyangiaceae bacterium]
MGTSFETWSPASRQIENATMLWDTTVDVADFRRIRQRAWREGYPILALT